MIMVDKVETIILFDTSVATDNLGDEIIMESISNGMQEIFSEYMTLRYSTHTPIMHLYQSMKVNDPQYVFFKNAKYKFIGGTNIFKKKMVCRRSDWNLNCLDR